MKDGQRRYILLCVGLLQYVEKHGTFDAGTKGLMVVACMWLVSIDC